MLIAAIPLMILVGHSILYATGKMASSGEMRDMAIVAPFWGVLAANGWTWLYETLNWRRPLRWAAIAALAPALINQRFQIGPVLLGYEVLPLQFNQDMVIARRVARWFPMSADCKASIRTFWRRIRASTTFLTSARRRDSRRASGRKRRLPMRRAARS